MTSLVSHVGHCVNDFLSAFESQCYTDVSIHVGDEVVKAHKLILRLRSPVFCTMLSEDRFKESEESYIDVKDSDPCTFKCFLRYLYCGKTDLDLENVLPLHHLAEKYLVGPLAASCIAYVLDNIGEDNVLWFLDTALLYNIQNLKETCLEFLQTSSCILNSKNLEHIREETVKEILGLESISTKENDLLDFLLEWKRCNEVNNIQHLLSYVRFPVISSPDLAKYYGNPDIPPTLLLEAYTYQANPSLFSCKDDVKFHNRERRDSLLTGKDLKCIEQATKKRLGEKLYSLERDGDSVSAFHRLCDPHPETLTVVKTSEALFGGFSDVSWGDSKGYIPQHSVVLFYKKPGEELQVFDTKQHSLENGVYCHRSWGPNFGGCTPFGLKRMSELSLNAWPKWDIVLVDRCVQKLRVFSMTNM